MYKDMIENLQKTGIKIKKDFFSLEEIDAPLLKGVNVLLESIDLKGSKLTPKGFLPTKIVKSIMDVAASVSERRYMGSQKRFLEEENISAGFARVVAQGLKLVKVQKGKLLLTKKGNEFLTLTPSEQYILLLYMALGINIGYFDRHQEAVCVQNSSVVMLQLLRDKDRNFRSVEVYAALLLDAYPMIDDAIDQLELLDYIEKDKFDIFVSIAETRLFERLFLPLGLVDMKVGKYPDVDKFAKSELLDTFMLEKNAINKELVLSKKLTKNFQEEIRKNRLEIDLFETTMYLFAQLSCVEASFKSSVQDTLMKKHLVIGTQKSIYEDFYKKLIDSVFTTFEEFSQLDTVGESRDDLVDKYKNMTDALFNLVNTTKPFNTVQNLHILPAFIFDILKLHYGLDNLSKEYILECSNTLGEEIAMDIGQLMLILDKLEKDAKKLKKNKPNFMQGVKEFLQTYMMIVLELKASTVL